MIETPESIEHQGWLTLRTEMWPDRSRAKHLMEMEFAMSHPHRFAQFICYFGPQKKAVGLAEVSIHHSGTGAEAPPLAHLDGIYVAPDFMRAGVAAKLVLAVSLWTKSMQCTEALIWTGQPTGGR